MINFSLIIIRNFVFVNVKHLRKYNFQIKQNTKISLTKITELRHMVYKYGVTLATTSRQCFKNLISHPHLDVQYFCQIKLQDVFFSRAVSRQPATYVSWEPTEAEVELLRQNPKRRKLEPGSTIGIYMYISTPLHPCQICLMEQFCCLH